MFKESPPFAKKLNEIGIMDIRKFGAIDLDLTHYAS